MPLYEFVCKQKHKTDAIVPYDTTHAKCSVCGAKAKRTTEPQLPARRDPRHGIQR